MSMALAQGMTAADAADLPAAAAQTAASATELTLDIAGPSFKSAILLSTPMRVTATAAGEVVVRLYEQVVPGQGRRLLHADTVRHPGGGAVVTVPFDSAYRGTAIYATAEQATTGAFDRSAFATDTKAFEHPRTEPADFTSWWEAKKADLAAVAPDWTETRLPEEDTEYSTAYKVTGAIGEGRMVTMWVAIPKAGPGSPAALTPEAKLPAMIVFPPAGNAHDRYFQTPATAAERVGAISVSVNLHEDIATGSDGTGTGGSYVQQGVTDRETNYFLDGIRRCLRAVDFVRQHPRFNGGDIMAFGESQGGGLAKIVAGLYPKDISLVVSQHDALSTHGARPDEPEGWPQWVSTFASSFEEVAYYDAAFHARRISARLMFSNTGFIDEIVPPSAALTSFNAFDVHEATKVVLLSEDRGHTSTVAYSRGYRDFARANLVGAIPPIGPPARPLAYENREVSIERSGDRLSATYSRAGATQDLTGGGGRWVQLSGPGQVSFARPTADTTTFSVSAGAPEDYKVGFEIEEFPAYSEYYVTTGIFDLGAVAPPSATLTSLTAEAIAGAAGGNEFGATLLEWATAAEFDNEAFAIERSADTLTWVTVGEVAGSGTTSAPKAYAFTDVDPLPGANYYRLRQRDFAGAESLSAVVVAIFGTSGDSPTTALAGIRVYPNPARDYVEVVGLPEAGAGAGVTLLDVAGRTVRVLSNPKDRASEDVSRLSLAGVAAGAYVLRIRSGGASVQRPIVVE